MKSAAYWHPLTNLIRRYLSISSSMRIGKRPRNHGRVSLLIEWKKAAQASGVGRLANLAATYMKPTIIRPSANFSPDRIRIPCPARSRPSFFSRFCSQFKRIGTEPQGAGPVTMQATLTRRAFMSKDHAYCFHKGKLYAANGFWVDARWAIPPDGQSNRPRFSD